MRGHLVGWILWWVALFWLWMLVAGDWNLIEWVAAACAAAIGATLAELARSAAGVAYRVPFRQLSRSLTVPFFVLVDFGIVMAVLARSLVPGRVVRGTFLERDFDAGGDDVAGAAHRAYTTIVAGYSPNAYVIDIDPRRNTVLLHDLVVYKRSEEPAGS